MKRFYNEYGLKFTDIVKLGKKKIIVSIILKYPRYEQFFAYRPETREKLINENLLKQYKVIQNILPFKIIKKRGPNRSPREILCELFAEELTKFKNIKIKNSIRIDCIEGLKKKDAKYKKEKSWFAVKGLVAIQFEGLKGGMQLYEERIIILKAYNHENAWDLGFKEFKKSNGNPYLNPAKLMVRWHFEKIVDVYEMSLLAKDKFDPKGTEVYSIFKKRKMKPEYEWHPIKKYKKV